MDRITLTGITARGHHGVYEHERRDGQTFRADVVCHLDLAPAGASDDVADTVHYGELAQAVAAEIAGESCDLIESLAERIARRVLSDARVRTVEVTLHKPQAPIPVEFSDVSVTITRSQP